MRMLNQYSKSREIKFQFKPLNGIENKDNDDEMEMYTFGHALSMEIGLIGFKRDQPFKDNPKKQVNLSWLMRNWQGFKFKSIYNYKLTNIINILETKGYKKKLQDNPNCIKVYCLSFYCDKDKLSRKLEADGEILDNVEKYVHSKDDLTNDETDVMYGYHILPETDSISMNLNFQTQQLSFFKNQLKLKFQHCDKIVIDPDYDYFPCFSVVSGNFFVQGYAH